MIGKRVMLEGPSTGWYAGHGGDEHGNCSLYLRTPWAGVVVFVDLDYQDQEEMPGPGEHPWIDAKYYQEAVMTAPGKLPRDLQERLDAILAKPLLRRAPTLAHSITVLVRNSYERQPPSVLTADQRELLEQLQAGEGEDSSP